MSSLDEQIGGNHYKEMPIQPVEFCQRNKLKYCESAAIKYICRHREKGGRQDIEKAMHYLALLLELDYAPIAPIGSGDASKFKFIDTSNGLRKE